MAAFATRFGSKAWRQIALVGVACMALSGCSTTPLMPYTRDPPASVLVPAELAGVRDQRARFREIYCAVLEARKQTLPDYRPCDEALTQVDRDLRHPAARSRGAPDNAQLGLEKRWTAHHRELQQRRLEIRRSIDAGGGPPRV